uniref:Uncharacterized protein n=1 Tax=Arundo donax TaxID=35708 RepID=A0A0A9FIN1_ARUDO
MLLQTLAIPHLVCTECQPKEQ